MLSAYAPLFRVPGATRFIAGTALSRTGGAMFGVAVIVMLSERRGSFGLAGAVSAVGLLVLAIAGPVIGRLVDKHGQRRVALPFVLFSAVCGVTVAVLSWRDAPAWALFVFYGLSAVLPEPGPMSRARWAHIYRDEPDRLHTAMSFEQVADEASFVVGPVLAVLVSTLWFPEAGLLVAELLFTAGMLAFLAARATEPPVVPHADRPGGLAVRRPGLLVVATALVMTGVIFGANEVIAVAYATEQGEKGFSSVILGGFALGSTLAGIVFGSRVFHSTLTRRLVLAATGMFVLEVPALLVGGLWPLVVVMVVAGSATAPMLITSLSLAQRLVPAALMTEGLAVAVTGILVGISGGSAVGGWAIDAWGAQPAYAVPVVAGGVALAIIAARYRHLERLALIADRHRRPCGAPRRWRIRRSGSARSQWPARMTATTCSSSSRCTRSARRPGSMAPTSSSPSSRAGVALAASTTASSGSPATCTAKRTARSIVRVLPAIAPVDASRATPSRTLHLRRAEHVVAVARPGRAHRVGHEDEPVGRAGRREAQDVGVEVHAIGDELDAGAGVLEQCEHRPGLAVVQRAHGVEQVRAGRRPGVERPARDGPARVGVAHGGDHAARRQHLDRLDPAVELGGEGHHAHRPAAGVDQPGHLGRVGGAQQGGLMSAAVRGTEPRTLEVDAGQLASVDERRQGQHGGLEPVHGVGDEARDERGRAVRPVGGDHRGRVTGIPRRERRSAAPVAVDVDEAGDEGAGEVPVG